jgi:hypothetical protein
MTDAEIYAHEQICRDRRDQLQKALQQTEARLQDLAEEAVKRKEARLRAEAAEARSKSKENEKCTQNLIDQKKCMVCMENEKELVNIPCGHVTMCTRCHEDAPPQTLMRCMVCREHVQKRQRVYL